MSAVQRARPEDALVPLFVQEYSLYTTSRPNEINTQTPMGRRRRGGASHVTARVVRPGRVFGSRNAVGNPNAVSNSAPLPPPAVPAPPAPGRAARQPRVARAD